MSAKVMGAVMTCGPKKVAVRFLLVAIADNADDYGFAYLSMETIADKACCSIRNAIRLVDALEREGWLTVRRHVFSGRSNVYFVNIEKLGVPVSEKSSKSRMHLEVERMLEDRKPSDKLSRGNSAPAAKPSDNSQGGQVTKTAMPSDKNALPILKNRIEPLKNQNNPLPPSQANGDEASRSAGSSSSEDKTGATCSEAVRKVMRELDISNPRMERVIARAIAAFRAKTDAPPDCNAVAELMIGRRGEYLKCEHVLKYQVGVRKFFQDGVWADGRQWVVDRRVVKEQRRL